MESNYSESESSDSSETERKSRKRVVDFDIQDIPKKKHKKNSKSHHFCKDGKCKSKKKLGKKSKSKKGKKSEKSKRRSSLSPTHAEPAVIYRPLVRKDDSGSRIPFLINLKSVCTFGTFKKRVLEACCPAHRVNARLFYEQEACKVQLNEASWAAFLHFLKSKEVPTFTLEVESSSTSACISSRRSTGLGQSGSFSSSHSHGSCISPINAEPKKSMLTTVSEHEWSSVYICGLPKKSREEAMKELLMNNIKEQQCKSCQISHRHKVAKEVETCVEALESMAEETIRYADRRQRRGRGSRYNEIRSLLR